MTLFNKKVISEKELETCQLNKNIEHLDEQIVLLESQLAAADVTIGHYRQVKRYFTVVSFFIL